MSKNNIFNNLQRVGRFSVTIVNETRYTLYLNKKELMWGVWHYEPATFIKPNTQSLFACVGTIFGGVEGIVEYLIEYGSFSIYWNVPFEGDHNFHIDKKDSDRLYKINTTLVTDGIVLNVEEME